MVNYGIVEQLKDVSILFFISVILAASGIFFMNGIDNNYLKIAFTILFIVSFYLVGMYYLNRKLLIDSIEIIKSKIRRKN